MGGYGREGITQVEHIMGTSQTRRYPGYDKGRLVARLTEPRGGIVPRESARGMRRAIDRYMLLSALQLNCPGNHPVSGPRPGPNGTAPSRRLPGFHPDRGTVPGSLAFAYAGDRGTTYGANAPGGRAAVLHGNRLGVLNLSFFPAFHAICIHNIPPKRITFQ